MWWKIIKSLLTRILIYGIVVINWLPDYIVGMKDVSVTIPTAVRRGENALLICNYDMENDSLYSVKWYKGKREFYRYTPKENPAMKIFPAPGITVEKALSNQSHVILSSVQLNLSGKYSCEVSADAPSFHTYIVSGNMEIVEIPEQRPIITSIHSRYRLGDVVNGNCSSDFSKPAANLTWTINDMPVPSGLVKVYEVQKNPVDNLESSVSEINFIVNHMHFIRGRLKLKCSAKIHSIYEQESDKIIEEDRPRILASGRSPDANLFPFDQQAEGDFLDPNDIYHYRDPSKSASSSLIKLKYSTKKLSTGKFINYFEKLIQFILISTTKLNFLLYISIMLSIFLVNKLLLNSFSLLLNSNNNNNNNNNFNNAKRKLSKQNEIIFNFQRTDVSENLNSS